MKISDTTLKRLRISRIVLLAIGIILVCLPSIIPAITIIWSNVLVTIGAICVAVGLSISLIISEEFNPMLYFGTCLIIIAIMIILVFMWF